MTTAGTRPAQGTASGTDQWDASDDGDGDNTIASDIDDLAEEMVASATRPRSR